MKLLGGGANRRVVFNNILTKFNGSFFNGSFHVYHPLQLLTTILCAASFEYALFSAVLQGKRAVGVREDLFKSRYKVSGPVRRVDRKMGEKKRGKMNSPHFSF